MTATPEPAQKRPAPTHLSPVERRVTGTLLEKVLSTPQSYPLTINSLLAGCNQRNNRDPEMNLTDGDVARVLEQLLEKGLVVMVRSESARSDKWRTQARDVFALGSEKGMAVFAELLLRGPQTLSELRRNSSRMRHELTEDEVKQILAEMAARETPLTANLGRAPGGRAERWTHTLYDEKEMAELKAGSTPPSHAAAAPSSAAAPAAAPADGDLARKLDAALAEIAALHERVKAIELKLSGE